MTKSSKPIFRFDFLRRLLRYASKYKLLFAGLGLLTILLALLSISRAVFIKYAFDEFILIPDLPGLLLFGQIILSLIVVEAFLQYAMSFGSSWLGQKIILQLREQVYEKIIHFKIAFLDKEKVGTLVARVTSDIEAISTVFSEGILTFIGDAFKILFILGVMAYFNLQLMGIVLLIFPFLILATRFFQKFMKRSFDDERSAIGNLYSFVQEHIQGMSIVQIFHKEEKEYNAFEVINERHRNATLRSVLYFSIFMPVIEVMSALAIGMVVWRGGLQVVYEGTSSPGDIVLFILLINMLFRPVRQLADRVNTIQRGLVASERIFKLLDTYQDDIQEEDKTLTSYALDGDIVFTNVRFGYHSDEDILPNFNATIQAQSNVAIVGATGSGKSTLLHLLGRLYEVTEGSISIGSHKIHNIPKLHLRKRISKVDQDVFLFSGTIMENLQIGNDVSEEDIRIAAEEIGILSYFDQLPNGLHFEVSERGGMLSAGQRQLIAFLRAYLYDPDILILDEATASIDSLTEQYIQTAFDRISKNRTTIVVAHRLSTIQSADSILLLDKGMLMEQGSHEHLLEQGGMYARLHQLQFVET